MRSAPKRASLDGEGGGRGLGSSLGEGSGVGDGWTLRAGGGTGAGWETGRGGPPADRHPPVSAGLARGGALCKLPGNTTLEGPGRQTAWPLQLSMPLWAHACIWCLHPGGATGRCRGGHRAAGWSCITHAVKGGTQVAAVNASESTGAKKGCLRASRAECSASLQKSPAESANTFRAQMRRPA